MYTNQASFKRQDGMTNPEHSSILLELLLKFLSLFR